MKSKIKIARNLLNNAIEMNVNRKIIHRLSRKIDSYIIAYYKEFGRLEVNAEQEGEQWLSSYDNNIDWSFVMVYMIFLVHGIYAGNYSLMEVSFTAVQAANKVLIIAGVIKLYKDIYTDMLTVLYTRRYFYRRSNYFIK